MCGDPCRRVRQFEDLFIGQGLLLPSVLRDGFGAACAARHDRLAFRAELARYDAPRARVNYVVVGFDLPGNEGLAETEGCIDYHFAPVAAERVGGKQYA